MGLLSSIGWLLSGAIGFLPGLHRYALYAVAIVSVLGMGALYVWNLASEGKAEAVARSEAACALQIADAETAATKAIAEILAETADAETPDSLSSYCKKNPGLCRSGK